MRRVVAGVGLAVVVALFLPEPSPEVRATSEAPLQWEDGVFEGLQARFEARREMGCEVPSDSLDRLEEAIANAPERPNSEQLQLLETRLFQASADAAACPEQTPLLLEAFARFRERIKDVSQGWDLAQRRERIALYRLLYGGRMAVEEALLQMQDSESPVPVLSRGRDEPSESPSVEIHGVRVHSGDMLVSRGGAPTSALIARGNDLPGNFSHVALVHIDEAGEFRTIEAHIEVGAVIAGLERYEEDAKLRVMLLRPRHVLAEQAGERFGFDASSHAIERVSSEHVPYDFQMDASDDERLFCSEVAFDAYRSVGIELWQGRTTTSSASTAGWLAEFGMREFETLGPSDLEYDPNLVVIAEWRDPEALFDDHVDTAVIDGLLASAADGEDVGFSGWKLPLARILKAYSVVLNLFGSVGPIPEGMSAQTGLRVEWLHARHEQVKERVLEGAEVFEEERGYRAPYWELVRLATEAAAATR